MNAMFSSIGMSMTSDLFNLYNCVICQYSYHFRFRLCNLRLQCKLDTVIFSYNVNINFRSYLFIVIIDFGDKT